MALENVITSLVLDVIDHDQTQGVVKAIALDSKTRYVQATVVQHGIDYDVDPNAVVTLTILRPDNVGVQITGSVVDVDNADRTGTIKGVYAELTQAALAKSGTLKAQFKMTDGQQILRTEIFQVKNGIALDGETSEWADQYEGYNLDELVQSVNSAVAAVTEIETDVSELKEELTALAPKEDMLKAFPTDTASGAVASFDDGANVPVKSLIVNIDPVQSGSGDPSPTNVRPISGWSEVNVGVSGKNLFDSNFSDYTKPYDYYIRPIKLESGKRYVIKAELVGTAVTGAVFGVTKKGDKYSEFAPYVVVTSSGTVASFEFTVDGTFTSPKLIAYVSGQAKFDEVMSNYNITLDVKADQNLYEPYNGTFHTISLGQTVYGGTLDVLSGELTVYPYYASYNGETLTGEWISDRDKYVSGTTPTIGAQVVNIGAQGVTVQLEPHEVASLYGVNNIWADSGDTTAEYRADTKLFIERLTAPDSADMIADANITSGQYFMVGNSLYKATANIANGSAIVVGTNCTRKSLSEALNELNT